MTTRKHVSTSEAPTPIGPYSQGVIAGGLLFVSGQIAIDPASSQLVSGDIEAQTEQVMKNLLAVLKAAKMGADNVVKGSSLSLGEIRAMAAQAGR